MYDADEVDTLGSIIAFSLGLNKDDIRGPVTLRFEELGGKVGHIDQYKRVFFPQNFKPIIGKPYVCYYHQTHTGIYVYQGERHRVCRVYLATEELNDSDVNYRSWKDEEKPEKTAFADALKSFKAPEVYETQAKEYKGKVRLSPVYKDSDPDFGNESTMYFFNTDDKLVAEKKYWVKVESKNSTHRRNQKGYLMVNVNVSI